MLFSRVFVCLNRLSKVDKIGLFFSQTQVMYKWIEPKVCVDGQKSVPLPASGLKKPCPPCNPGMEFNNGTCRFCTAGEFSDGINPCSRCTATTAPVRELVYKWWNSLPDEANITSACLSLAGKCRPFHSNCLYMRLALWCWRDGGIKNIYTPVENL